MIKPGVFLWVGLATQLCVGQTLTLTDFQSEVQNGHPVHHIEVRAPFSTEAGKKYRCRVEMRPRTVWTRRTGHPVNGGGTWYEGDWVPKPGYLHFVQPTGTGGFPGPTLDDIEKLPLILSGESAKGNPTTLDNPVVTVSDPAMGRYEAADPNDPLGATGYFIPNPGVSGIVTLQVTDGQLNKTIDIGIDVQGGSSTFTVRCRVTTYPHALDQSMFTGPDGDLRYTRTPSHSPTGYDWYLTVHDFITDDLLFEDTLFTGAN